MKFFLPLPFLPLPFLGLLLVPLYNRAEPVVFGFPFFYWYMFAWVPLTSLILFFVYRRGGVSDD